MPARLLIEVFALALHAHDFLLRTAAVIAFRQPSARSSFRRLIDFCTVIMLVSKSAQPALIHVEHLAAVGFFGDGFLRLALGADEQNRLALRRHFDHIARRVLEELQGFLQIDDVDTVTFAKDVFLHLWIPALGLVPEVNAGFEQFFH